LEGRGGELIALLSHSVCGVTADDIKTSQTGQPVLIKCSHIW